LLLASIFIGIGNREVKGSEAMYELVVIDPKDVPQIRDWAERWCRGASIPDLADGLGVGRSKDAIISYLSKGLTDEGREAVKEVCERELVEGPGSSSG
jgi:hypothetical protein